MRALGIPCRVVTNYNSAHDTNKNLVIEEYYNEKGEKLNYSNDSIWLVVTLTMEMAFWDTLTAFCHILS